MQVYHKQFRCEVLTPAGPVVKTEAVLARLPLMDGSLGVLAGRAPMMALLGAGPLEIQKPDGAEDRYFVAGGFAHVRGNSLSILAEQCTPVGELDHQAVTAEMETANGMPADSPEQRTRRRRALAVASAKMKLLPGQVSQA